MKGRILRRPKPVKLPLGTSIPELFQITKPVEIHGVHPFTHLGEWLATILVSKTADPIIRKRALSKAGELLGEPAPTAKLPPRPVMSEAKLSEPTSPREEEVDRRKSRILWTPGFGIRMER